MKKFYLFFLFCLTLISTKVFAADYYWTGKGADSNYNTLANWALGNISGGTPTVTPGANDNVFFTDAATKFNVSFNASSIVFNNFTSSSTLNQYLFELNAPNNSSKTLSISGLLNITNKAKFNSNQIVGDENKIGLIIINKTPIIDNNEFNVYLKFNKAGETIKPNTGFKAQGIFIENGVNLDLSNLNIQLGYLSNTDSNTGILKISDSTTKINLNNSILEIGRLWIRNLDLANSNFSNSQFTITRGSIPNDFSHTVLPSSSNVTNGIVVESINNLELPNVVFDYKKPTNSWTKGASIISPTKLSINNLTIKGQPFYFDTTQLEINNLTIDKGQEYIFYGASTPTSPTVFPNVKINSLIFNSSTSGTTGFRSFELESNKVSYLDIPVIANYQNLVANNIYSKNVVTFENSKLQNTTVNINVTNPIEENFYWTGLSDGIDWYNIQNWSSSPTSDIPVSNLPTSFDNVHFNNRSVVKGKIILDKLVDINDFTIHTDFNSSLFIENRSKNSLIMRGSVELKNNVTFDVIKWYLIPNATTSSNAETFSQNNAILEVSVGNQLIITGKGYLKIIGDVFNYNLGSNSTVIFEGGTLAFETPIVNIGYFNSKTSTTSLFQKNLILNNAIINVYTWEYSSQRRDNFVDHGFLLSAGNSQLNVKSLAIVFHQSTPLIENLKRVYNDIILESNSGSYVALNGPLDVKNLTVKSDFRFGNVQLDNTQSNVDNLTLKRGINIAIGNFTNSHSLNILRNLILTNDACNSMTTITGLGPASSKINFASTFNTPNILLDNFVISGIAFSKFPGSTIIVNGETSNVTGVEQTNTPSSKNYYWIASNGTSSNIKNWHDPLNWTDSPTGIGGNQCTPSKFDNAIFSNFSGGNTTKVTIQSSIYINNIIFDQTSNPGIEFLGGSSRDLFLYGSMYLNRNTFTSFNRIMPSGTATSPRYNPLSTRHEIDIKNSNFKSLDVRFQSNSYYKLVNDYISVPNNVSTGSSIILNYNSDLDASGIKLDLSRIEFPVGSAYDKLNLDNSTVNLIQYFKVSNSLANVTSNNTIFNIGRLDTSTNEFTYNGLNSSSNFASSKINFLSKNNVSTVEGPLNTELKVSDITVRATTANFNNLITTNNLNSVANKIVIMANKELKILNNAYISGTSCSTTQSIVSSVAGTRAKLSILGGETDFDYLTIKDIDGESSYKNLVFGVYSTNGGNNTAKVTFLNPSTTPSTHGFDAVYACRDITVNNILSADGFYPNTFTTYEWYKIDGATKTLVATTKDIDLNQANFGYGTYELNINYDPTTAGSCVITDDITISPFPTAPNELADDKFCKKDVVTLADVDLPGYDLVWYPSSSSSIALPSTTTIVSGTTYYVARKNQSNAGLVCESSDRLALVLTLDACGGVYINPALRLRAF